MSNREKTVRAAIRVLYGHLEKGVHILSRKDLIDEIKRETNYKSNDIIDFLSEEKDGWNRILYSPAQGYVLSNTGLKFARNNLKLDKGGEKAPRKESDYYEPLKKHFEENYHAEVITNKGKQSGRRNKRPDLQILIPPGGGGFNPNLYEIWNIEIKDDPLQFADIEQTDGYRRGAHYVFLMSTIDPASSPNEILEEISERGIGLYCIKRINPLTLELRHVPTYQEPVEADINKAYRDVFGYEVCPICGVFFKLPKLKRGQWTDKAYANRLIKRTSPFGGHISKKYLCDACIGLLKLSE